MYSYEYVGDRRLHAADPTASKTSTDCGKGCYLLRVICFYGEFLHYIRLYSLPRGPGNYRHSKLEMTGVGLIESVHLS